MLRRRSVVFMPVVSSSLMDTRPEVGSMMRLIILSVVVLPQPEGPRRMQISPSGTSMVMWSAAVTGPSGVSKTLVRFSMRIIRLPLSLFSPRRAAARAA